MFGGINPTQMAKMQEVSRNILGEITVSYSESTVLLRLSTQDPEAVKLIPNLLEQFSGALAAQLEAFFAISGKIKEIGKNGVKKG